MKRLVDFTAVLMLAVTAPAASISIDPVSTTTSVGRMVDLNVDVTDVADLYAYQFDIEFNPRILSATSVSEGAFLSGGGGTLFITGSIDPTAGTITFTANTLLGAVPGVSGSGTLARVRFQAISHGTSAITLSNFALLNSTSGDIFTTVKNGSVTIIPEPSYALVLGAVIGVGFLRRWLDVTKARRVANA